MTVVGTKNAKEKNMEDSTLILTMKDGKKVTCEILFTYHSEEFGNDYVVFRPEGDSRPSAAKYIEEGDGNGTLSEITTDAEWDMLDEILNDYYQEQEKKKS